MSLGADRKPVDACRYCRSSGITLEMRIEDHYRRTASEEEVDLDQAFDDAGNTPFAGITTALRPARG
jgi:Fe-S cluster biogenesis protein NfuA